MESLFSLEVIVNYIKLKHPYPLATHTNESNEESPATVCLFPTLAFRLLDYPTIAIHLLDQYDASQIKKQFTNINKNTSNQQIAHLPCFKDLLDSHGRYTFSKGKSCLFRCDLKNLRNHLRHTPMYLMLLDTFFDPYKLVGTTAVPLTNLINDIYSETDGGEDTDKACTKLTHGVFEIKNLMGNEIGFVSFACRLTSFGTSLLPHIERTTAESIQRQIKLKNNEKKTVKKTVDLVENSDPVKPVKNIETPLDDSYYFLKKQPSKSTNTVETMKNSSVLVQTMKIDYMDAKVQIGEGTVPDKKDQSTQSLLRRQVSSEDTENKKPVDLNPDSQEIKPANVYKVVRAPEEPLSEHFCPPVLYYNLNDDKDTPVKSVFMGIVEKQKFMNERIDYLNKGYDCLVDDEDKPAPATDEGEYELPVRQESSRVNTSSSSFDLSKMPLLQCLFEEINILKSQMKVGHEVLSERNVSTINSNKLLNGKEILSKSPSARPEVVKINPNVVKASKSSGILRNNKTKKKLSNLKKPSNTFSSKQTMVESVNRLAQPRQPSGRKDTNNQVKRLEEHPKFYSEYDETPVGPFVNNSENDQKLFKKQPLKYGTTRAHQMRVKASHKTKNEVQDESPNQLQKIYKQELVSAIKSNLDHLNNSRQTQQLTSAHHNQTTDSELLSRNLDKVMFETIDSTIKDTSLFKTHKSMNFSLLNKVEMDATNECTVNDRHTLANIEETASSIFDQSPKVKNVQFGNTYILSTSALPTSTEESTLGRPTSDLPQHQSLTNVSRSFEDTLTRTDTQESASNNRNIFIDNRGVYEDDFYSSVESSEKVTPRAYKRTNVRNDGGKDFFDKDESDYEDNSYGEIEYLGMGDDDFLRSGSKHSNNYNSKSFVTDSLATRDSVRSSRSSRHS